MKCVFGHAKTKCIFLVFDKIQKSTIFMNKDKKSLTSARSPDKKSFLILIE